MSKSPKKKLLYSTGISKFLFLIMLFSNLQHFSLYNNNEMSMLFCIIVQVSKESLRIATSMLSNNTETPLVFRVMTKAPFILVDMDPSTNVELSTRTISTQMQTLRPKHNLIVSVYTLSYKESLLNTLCICTCCES